MSLIIRSIVACVSMFVGALAAPPPAQVRSLPNSYWSTAGGFSSTIHLHNVLLDEPLVVTIELHDSRGQVSTLRPITLPPLGNAEIEIGPELRKIGWTAQEGAAIFRYTHQSDGALIAEISVINAAASLAYTITSELAGRS